VCSHSINSIEWNFVEVFAIYLARGGESENREEDIFASSIYCDGKGVPEDDTEAVKWYRKAAEQGYAEAQYNLGVMYTNGEGVPEDYVESYMWWNLAAAQGIEQAKGNKEILSKQMTKEQIAEAQKLSREWLANYSK
jgi:TPR repeat protein